MENRYIRVGTTLHKIVRKPLHSGDFMEVRLVWNYDTLKQDHSKDFLSEVKKYDGFCCVPSHTDYKPMIGSFLNEYQAIEATPKAGKFPRIEEFLQHIFGEQYQMGLDYLQLLYKSPLQRLPIILLVSQQRNTGKTTFLNLLKAIFGANMTFNTNEDFRSQFNSDWATKLIVAVDEVLLDRREDSERIKNLSTARSYKAEAKGKDRNEVEFFAKFVLCSNNELNPIYIEQGETRYWVRKIDPIGYDNPNLLAEMKLEIPALLNHLLNRELTTKNESRMWFDPALLRTSAFRKMVSQNRGKIESEMIQIIADIMDIKESNEYRFSIGDMAHMLEMRGHRSEHTYIRKILQQKWKLKPSAPKYYTSERLLLDGTFQSLQSTTARCYTVKKEMIDEFM